MKSYFKLMNFFEFALSEEIITETTYQCMVDALMDIKPNEPNDGCVAVIDE